MLANNVVVLDFETTGLFPEMGDRAIEIGAVKLVNGQVVDTFQALINPGQRVNSFIEQYTGISNQMLKDAPTSKVVMGQFAEFIDGFNLVAHNASFDKKFLDAEFSANRLSYNGQFACSLLLSRRISQEAPNHKLATLVEHHQLPNEGVFHRALADATMTAQLWLHQLNLLQQQLPSQQITFDIISNITHLPKAKIVSLLQALR
ncbi:PolC-type DNA polymerase III [Shewanella sp. SR44-3]|uniref:3'-5' exonuclease n=1 Tax=Shewanella sp. SR44-3 TaxID=2760936 RepID=UPI001C71E331|nr:3'-5' exonuclease [Shewanella sp. SR44-3]